MTSQASPEHVGCGGGRCAMCRPTSPALRASLLLLAQDGVRANSLRSKQGPPACHFVCFATPRGGGLAALGRPGGGHTRGPDPSCAAVLAGDSTAGPGHTARLRGHAVVLLPLPPGEGWGEGIGPSRRMQASNTHEARYAVRVGRSPLRRRSAQPFADEGSRLWPTPGRPKAAEPPPRGVAKHTKWQAGGAICSPKASSSETPRKASTAGEPEGPAQWGRSARTAYRAGSPGPRP